MFLLPFFLLYLFALSFIRSSEFTYKVRTQSMTKLACFLAVRWFFFVVFWVCKSLWKEYLIKARHLFPHVEEVGLVFFSQLCRLMMLGASSIVAKLGWGGLGGRTTLAGGIVEFWRERGAGDGGL